MEYLRPRFILIALAVALAAYEIGGGGLIATIWGRAWFLELIVRTVIPTAETVHRAAIAPPPPVRLTHGELAEREQRLKAVFGPAIPATLLIWDKNFVTLRDRAACFAQRPGTAITINDACDAVNPNPFVQFVLAHTDPQTETFFVREGRDRNIHVRFFLGKDGKAKILMQMSGMHLDSDKWINVVLPGGTRTLLTYTGVRYTWFGDDPGPSPDQRFIHFDIVSKQRGQEKVLDLIKPDPELEQRFRYYAALKNKPFDPEEWTVECYRSAYWGCVPP